MSEIDLFGGGAPLVPEKAAPTVLSVGEITRQIRKLLERGLGEVWIKGEISNLRAHGSGHLYFSLKDEEALIQAVMFRTEAARLGFQPKDGQAVQIFGRVTVYEPRGQYQIVVQAMQPQGRGSLQERFEALKRKLQAEGLFDLERKRPLPVFPEKVGLVTALQGAVLQDFCRILARRAPGIVIQVYGCRVQGPGAAEEVAAGIATFNRRAEVAVIVVARGGGSLEDLWAFNEEVVARALFASAIPTVSAVGHETDFTMADFVADVRAPTPSAAAELVSREWSEWREEVSQWERRLVRGALGVLQGRRERVERLAGSYVFREPVRLVQQAQQRVDRCAEELVRALSGACGQSRHRLEKLLVRWESVHPKRRWERERERLGQWESRLKALGPEATLARGYALVLDQAGEVIKSVEELSPTAPARLRLKDGERLVKVVE